MGYVDLHSHLLAGLDDGPQRFEDSMYMAEALIRLGYDTLCVTPHQRLGLHTPDLGAVRTAATDLKAALDAAGHAVAVVAGTENCWDELLWQRSRAGEIPCYGTTQTFLFDLPGWSVPSELVQHLFQWRLKGHVPVLGHVERYGDTPDLITRLKQLAEYALLTVNLDAVGGGMGRPMARLAQKLLRVGFPLALTTDLHDATSLQATADGLSWVKKHLGDEALRVLLDENPREVLAGHLPG